MNDSIELPNSYRVPSRSVAAQIMYLTSDQYLEAVASEDNELNDYPTPANIERELERKQGSSVGQSTISGALRLLRDEGFVEDRNVSGSNRPYQPTEKGQEFLDQNEDLYASLLEE